MHEHFELLDGFIGHSVAQRKGIEARRAFSDRLFDKTEQLELRMTPEQLQASVDAYCSRLHTTGRDELGGRTPEQMAHGHARSEVAERALDVLLAPSADGGLRRIGKKGLRIGGGFYNHALLGGIEGTQVQVKVDEANLGRCWVFDMDGVYVCEALDYERLGISSAEVAQTRKAHQAKVLKAQKRQLKQLTREFDTRAAIDAITSARTQDAVAAAANVTSLPPTTRQAQALVHTSPTIASIVAAAEPQVPAEQLERAQAALAARAAQPAQVKPLLATQEQRYARWLQLQARVERNEALSADERNWFDGYANGAEWTSMRSYFQTFGLTPEQVLAG
jgi:hypothetical protein